MIGAELNAAIQEEWPAPVTHADRLRGRLKEKAQEKVLEKEQAKQEALDVMAPQAPDIRPGPVSPS